VSVNNRSQKTFSYTKVTKFMKLLKYLTLALAITASMVSLSPAFAAGKIENATAAQVKEAADSALASTEQALEGLKNNSNQEVIFQHIATARQDTKRIEVGRLDVKRNQASAKLKDARIAITKDEKEKAEALLTEAVGIYKEIQNSL
jgi:hypothetical protein